MPTASMGHEQESSWRRSTLFNYCSPVMGTHPSDSQQLFPKWDRAVGSEKGQGCTRQREQIPRFMICIQIFLGRCYCLLLLLLLLLLKFADIDRYALLSSHERGARASFFGAPATRFLFLPERAGFGVLHQIPNEGGFRERKKKKKRRSWTRAFVPKIEMFCFFYFIFM